jgi:hypothetical protein
MLSTRYFCNVLMKLEFSRQIFERKNAQISNFMKIRLVGAGLFHANGQTDERTTKVIVACRNFAHAPNNASTESFVGLNGRSGPSLCERVKAEAVEK